MCVIKTAKQKFNNTSVLENVQLGLNLFLIKF